MLVTTEMQRAVRLKGAITIDLEPVIGAKLTLRIGEVPLSHQVQLFELLEGREELTEAKANGAVGAGAMARWLDRAVPIVKASLLDEHGDPLKPMDADAIFGLIPAGPRGLTLLQSMVFGLLERLKPQEPPQGK